MSKYLMNKLIHHVNMNESAEDEYVSHPRGFVEKWEKGQKLKFNTRRARSAGDQGLWQALCPGRPSVHALEFHRSGLDPRKAERRVSQRLQRKSRQGRLS